MLPVERQTKIKALLNDYKVMKISELSIQLGVSDMTIHRDLKPLIDEGFLMKTFGGVSLNQGTSNQPEIEVDTCVICQRECNERLAYRLILENNEIELTCCAHCGLMRHRQLADKVVQAMCHDFLRETTINAPLAWFVLDTSINIGCCQPQVLTFELKEHAEQFVKGFGGYVYGFQAAVNMVHKQMSCTSCNQSK